MSKPSLDDQEMPLIAHLTELRKRLLRSVIAIGLVFAGLFYFSQQIYALVAAPLRAYRRRDKILKFEGGFHGMSEYSLQSLSPKRPGNFPQAAPDSPGIPRSVSGDMVIAPFNDADATASLIKQHADELAGVIVEPFQRLLPPKPGFLRGLREVADQAGILLVLDEIQSGLGRTGKLFVC